MCVLKHGYFPTLSIFGVCNESGYSLSAESQHFRPIYQLSVILFKYTIAVIMGNIIHSRDAVAEKYSAPKTYYIPFFC